MKIILLMLLVSLALALIFCLFVVLVSHFAEKALDSEVPEYCRNTTPPKVPRA